MENKENGVVLRPIAYIRTDFTEKFGIPRQSGRAPSLLGRIIFTPEYRNDDALRGITGYTYLWLIFDFTQSHMAGWSPTVRPPRLGGNRRMGVFATRSPFRPNPLGLSCVKLEGLEKTPQGTIIHVSGVDILDNTPIYDIKPYLPHADCKPDAAGGFSDTQTGYHLEVDFPEELLTVLPEEKRTAAVECLADDPRPSYQNDDREYSMSFAGYDIHFHVADGVLTVTGVDVL
ncbi:MAG: tRNA (N6-threonylcarbamoyladenosine(37)-N6)-methyltransferase TrmO [Ruminococcus sp.]|nr:tRNA (N6-threonylcarbamoyladenosine(37)-N6)-methyltransferase TrmO [Ruminococcus sp.]